MDIKELEISQKLELTDRKRFMVNAVQNVEHFTDSEIILKTAKGGLKIVGTNLNLEDLSKENANISVTGKIDAMEFFEKKEKGSFFKDLFK